MKFIFLVQGEGRGHISQAISLYSILTGNGHEVSAALIGKSPRRKVPEYFYTRLPVFTASYHSPNFIVARNRKGINLVGSFLYNFLKAPLYFLSILQIRKVVKAKNPDVIVNFYDILGGFYNFFYRDKRMVCIGHHFYYSHPSAQLPEGRMLEKTLLLALNKMVSYGATTILALSFRQAVDDENGKLRIVPPLLRKEFTVEKQITITDQLILVGYLLNDGFANEAIEWCNLHKDVDCHFFWDKPDTGKEMRVSDNLVFHQINDLLFAKYMKMPGLYASTAGFESLCEAMYLGKPFLCVPSEGHYEQACNALDATRDGAGISDQCFNLDRLLEFQKTYSFDCATFREWICQADKLLIRHLTEL